jgi:hypothetical protein
MRGSDCVGADNAHVDSYAGDDYVNDVVCVAPYEPAQTLILPSYVRCSLRISAKSTPQSRDPHCSTS